MPLDHFKEDIKRSIKETPVSYHSMIVDGSPNDDAMDDQHMLAYVFSPYAYQRLEHARLQVYGMKSLMSIKD